MSGKVTVYTEEVFDTLEEELMGSPFSDMHMVMGIEAKREAVVKNSLVIDPFGKIDTA